MELAAYRNNRLLLEVCRKVSNLWLAQQNRNIQPVVKPHTYRLSPL